MSASLLNVLKLVPVPIFGTAATAFQFGAKKATSAPRYAQWALPAVAGGIWFVWPAVDEEWKQSILSGSSAEELAATSADESKVVLSEEAKEKIEKAYVVESESETAESFSDAEKEVMKAAQMGDFTLLEKEWDSFQLKASNPEEDDDDDDDDEEEEEEEEEDDDDEEEDANEDEDTNEDEDSNEDEDAKEDEDANEDEGANEDEDDDE